MFSIYSRFSSEVRVVTTRGFGLIELMISISIMAMVSTVILARQGAFDNAVLLRNQAYEVALDIRELQFSSVSATGENNVFGATAGMYFDTAGANDQFTVYRDVNNNQVLAGSELSRTIKLDPRFAIQDIQVGATSQSDVLVVFQRPNFDAKFYSAMTLNSGNEYAVAKVCIEIVRVGTSNIKVVEITSTGQIAVVNLCS